MSHINIEVKYPIVLRVNFFDINGYRTKLDFKRKLHGQSIEDLPGLFRKATHGKKIDYAQFQRVIMGYGVIPAYREKITLDSCDGDINQFNKKCIEKILYIMKITKIKNKNTESESGINLL